MSTSDLTLARYQMFNITLRYACMHLLTTPDGSNIAVRSAISATAGLLVSGNSVRSGKRYGGLVNRGPVIIVTDVSDELDDTLRI